MPAKYKKTGANYVIFHKVGNIFNYSYTFRFISLPKVIPVFLPDFIIENC